VVDRGHAGLERDPAAGLDDAARQVDVLAGRQRLVEALELVEELGADREVLAPDVRLAVPLPGLDGGPAAGHPGGVRRGGRAPAGQVGAPAPAVDASRASSAAATQPGATSQSASTNATTSTGPSARAPRLRIALIVMPGTRSTSSASSGRPAGSRRWSRCRRPRSGPAAGLCARSASRHRSIVATSSLQGTTTPTLIVTTPPGASRSFLPWPARRDGTI
jgi:hypothetical protein